MFRLKFLCLWLISPSGETLPFFIALHGRASYRTPPTVSILFVFGRVTEISITQTMAVIEDIYKDLHELCNAINEANLIFENARLVASLVPGAGGSNFAVAIQMQRGVDEKTNALISKVITAGKHLEVEELRRLAGHEDFFRLPEEAKNHICNLIQAGLNSRVQDLVSQTPSLKGDATDNASAKSGEHAATMQASAEIPEGDSTGSQKSSTICSVLERCVVS